MALAFDAASTATPAPGTSLTWAHTCSGSNRLLLVGFSLPNDSTGLTGITYSGVAMTHIGSTVTMADGTLIDLYYLIAPASGANNIVASFESTAFNAVGVATSYTDAQQSGQPDSSNTGTATTVGSLTIATTVVAANGWQVLVTRTSNYSNTNTAGTGSTIRAGGSATNAEDLAIFDSNGTVATGSRSMQSTSSGSPNWGGITASIAVVTGGVVTPARLLIMGVG